MMTDLLDDTLDILFKEFEGLPKQRIKGFPQSEGDSGIKNKEKRKYVGYLFTTIGLKASSSKQIF